eukprot:1706395-Amphidinium_carterae.1
MHPEWDNSIASHATQAGVLLVPRAEIKVGPAAHGRIHHKRNCSPESPQFGTVVTIETSILLVRVPII